MEVDYMSDIARYLPITDNVAKHKQNQLWLVNHVVISIQQCVVHKTLLMFIHRPATSNLHPKVSHLPPPPPLPLRKTFQII